MIVRGANPVAVVMQNRTGNVLILVLENCATLGPALSESFAVEAIRIPRSVLCLALANSANTTGTAKSVSFAAGETEILRSAARRVLESHAKHPIIARAMSTVARTKNARPDARGSFVLQKTIARRANLAAVRSETLVNTAPCRVWENLVAIPTAIARETNSAVAVMKVAKRAGCPASVSRAATQLIARRSNHAAVPMLIPAEPALALVLGQRVDGERIVHQGKRAAMENVPRIALSVIPMMTAVKIHGAVAEEPQSQLFVRATRPVLGNHAASMQTTVLQVILVAVFCARREFVHRQ